MNLALAHGFELRYKVAMLQKSKFVFTVIALFISVSSWGQTQSCNNRAIVEKFFSNYSLIGDWSSFTVAQSQLLSTSLQTVASDHRGVSRYAGPSGYFQSLADWSAVFATGADFRMEIVQVTPTRVVARLHGTLTLKTPVQGYRSLNDQQHRWTEVFTIKEGCKISKLEVLMNLFKGSPVALDAI